MCASDGMIHKNEYIIRFHTWTGGRPGHDIKFSWPSNFSTFRTMACTGTASITYIHRLKQSDDTFSPQHFAISVSVNGSLPPELRVDNIVSTEMCLVQSKYWPFLAISSDCKHPREVCKIYDTCVMRRAHYYWCSWWWLGWCWWQWFGGFQH